MDRLDDYLRDRWFRHSERDPDAAATAWLTAALHDPQAAELLSGLVRERAGHQFRTFQRVTYERTGGRANNTQNWPAPPAHRGSGSHSTHGSPQGTDDSQTPNGPAVSKVQRWLQEEVWIPDDGMKLWRDVTATDLKKRGDWLDDTMRGVRASLRFIRELAKALEANGVDTVGELPETALPKVVRQQRTDGGTW